MNDKITREQGLQILSLSTEEIADIAFSMEESKRDVFYKFVEDVYEDKKSFPMKYYEVASERHKEVHGAFGHEKFVIGGN